MTSRLFSKETGDMGWVDSSTEAVTISDFADAAWGALGVALK